MDNCVFIFTERFPEISVGRFKKWWYYVIMIYFAIGKYSWVPNKPRGPKKRGG